MFEGNLIANMETLSRQLDDSVDDLELYGIQLAEADAKYAVESKKVALIERENKTPVSIIAMVVKGNEKIANLKKDRDIIEAKKDACQERINTLKLQLRIIDAQAAREWTRSSDY